MRRLAVFSLALSASPVLYSTWFYLSAYDQSRPSFVFALLILLYAVPYFLKRPRIGYLILAIPIAMSTWFFIGAGDMTAPIELAGGYLLAFPAVLLYAFYEEESDLLVSLIFYFFAYVLALLLATASLVGATEPLQYFETLTALILAIDLGIFGSFLGTGTEFLTTTYLRDTVMSLATMFAAVGVVLRVVRNPSQVDHWNNVIGVRDYRIDLFTRSILVATIAALPFVLIVSLASQSMLLIIGAFLIIPITYLFRKLRKIHEI